MRARLPHSKAPSPSPSLVSSPTTCTRTAEFGSAKPRHWTRKTVSFELLIPSFPSPAHSLALRLCEVVRRLSEAHVNFSNFAHNLPLLLLLPPLPTRSSWLLLSHRATAPRILRLVLSVQLRPLTVSPRVCSMSRRLNPAIHSTYTKHHESLTTSKSPRLPPITRASPQSSHPLPTPRANERRHALAGNTSNPRSSRPSACPPFLRRQRPVCPAFTTSISQHGRPAMRNPRISSIG